MLLVRSMSSPCMECCRESLEPASMRLFHNNIAQNYRVEGASPLWVENSQLATLCPRPPPPPPKKNGGHDRVGRLTYILPGGEIRIPRCPVKQSTTSYYIRTTQAA